MIGSSKSLKQRSIPLPVIDSTEVQEEFTKTWQIRHDYKLGSELKFLLDKIPSDAGYVHDDQKIEVVITVSNLLGDESSYLETVEVTDVLMLTDEKVGNTEYRINGKNASLTEVRDITKKTLNETKARSAKVLAKHKMRINKLAKKYGWENRKSIKASIKAGSRSFVVSMTKDEILTFLHENNQDIASIDLPKKVIESLSSAMVATNIDPIALTWNTMTRGSGIGIYYNEASRYGACPNPEITAFNHNYVGLHSPIAITGHTVSVGGVIRTVAPEASLYCDSLYRDGENADAYMYPFPLDDNSSMWILSYSWNTYSDTISGVTYNTDYSDLDMVFDDYVYDNGKFVFVSASNHQETNTYSYVLSPAKAFNVIAVGNYEDPSMIINSDSAFVNPTTGNQKPEISAPGTNITFDYVHEETMLWGGTQTTAYTSTVSGTSFATPHAAAFAADAMSENSFLQINRAPMMKAHMLASASDDITGGRNATGEGGIDFSTSLDNSRSLAYLNSGDSESPFPYIGTDGSGKAWYCKTDWKSYFYASDTEARIVISWLNRGEYVLANGETGIDLDLWILGPDNATWYSNGGLSTVDPYALVTFNPPTTGYYTAYICKEKDIDNLSRIDLGYAATATVN